MDKIRYLRECFAKTEKNRVKKALLQCLSPCEICELLDLEFEQSSMTREIIISRIREDMITRFEDFHTELVESLICRLDILPASKLISCAYCLECFCRVCCRQIKQKIVTLFLRSKRKDFRNRAYNILESDWDVGLAAEVNALWQKWLDPGCTMLVLKYADPDFIQENFDLLFVYLPGLRYMAKLFERLPEVDNEKLERLKEEDAITYTYVLARLNLRLTELEAMKIYEENKHDDRLNILLWAYGRLKLWSVLLHIESDLVDNAGSVMTHMSETAGNHFNACD